MKSQRMDTRRILYMAGAVAAMLAASPAITQATQSRATAAATVDPACQSLTLTSAGGAAPRDRSTLLLRWLGASNFELVFRGSVVLLDAYFERMPRTRPLGFTRDDIKRATAIVVGHGHGDHMADAPYVAMRTGARVVGGPPTIEAALKQGLPAKQAVTVKGGEVEKFDGFTVEAILARHSDLNEVQPRAKIFGPALAAVLALEPPLTDDEKRRADEIRTRGTSDRRVLNEGTVAFLFTFDTGFTFLFLDSAGAITDGERALMNRIKTVDIASVAYQGMFLATPQIRATLPLVKHFNPTYFIPNHHDEIAGQFWDMATYPLSMAIRDELPGTKFIDPLYRTPMCFNTVTRQYIASDGAVRSQSSR
jgi:L-ascorbate metabolism protein UlaG (beta-lactamase superfamily)